MRGWLKWTNTIKVIKAQLFHSRVLEGWNVIFPTVDSSLFGVPQAPQPPQPSGKRLHNHMETITIFDG